MACSQFGIVCQEDDTSGAYSSDGSHVLIPGRGSFLCSTQTKMGLETTLRSVVSMRTK